MVSRNTAAVSVSVLNRMERIMGKERIIIYNIRDLDVNRHIDNINVVDISRLAIIVSTIRPECP